MERKTYGILKKGAIAIAALGVATEISLIAGSHVLSTKANKAMKNLDPVVNVQEYNEAQKQDDLSWQLAGGAGLGMLVGVAGAVGGYAFWCKENGWKVRGVSRKEEVLGK